MTRIPLLYLAPWVDIGGSDKGTLDWFRSLRDRFRASLITTQPSPNRRLDEIRPMPRRSGTSELMPGGEFPRFILTFIHTRGVRLVHIMNSRLGFELLPHIAHLPDPPRVVVQLHVEEPDYSGYVRYVTTRYGNLVDAFSVSSQGAREAPRALRGPRVQAPGDPDRSRRQREFSPLACPRSKGSNPASSNPLSRFG